MRPRIPLPPELTGAPFRVSDALDAGLGAARLRHPELERPFRGVRTLGVVVTELDVVESYAPLLRTGDRFSHSSAAMLWGAPLPASIGGGVHVTAGPGLDRPRRRGVVGHRVTGGRAVSRRGLPCSDAVSTFREMATVLQLDDLVALGDHLILDPRVIDPGDSRPYTTLPELRDAVDAASGRGARLARVAAALMRGGVESPRETLLRLLLWRAGLPPPLCGAAVTDERGRHIGWFDLVWPEFRTIAEYDGDQHRTSTRQYERDITRFDRASDAGHRVIRVRSRGLLETPGLTVDRVRAALVRGGWAPRGE